MRGPCRMEVTPVEVVGVHPIDAPEPCHLVELIWRSSAPLDFSAITQEDPNVRPDGWQVPWDERVLSQDSDGVRYAFFFHYLQPDKPLQTAVGPIGLPETTRLAPHLQAIQS